MSSQPADQPQIVASSSFSTGLADGRSSQKHLGAHVISNAEAPAHSEHEALKHENGTSKQVQSNSSNAKVNENEEHLADAVLKPGQIGEGLLNASPIEVKMPYLRSTWAHGSEQASKFDTGHASCAQSSIPTSKQTTGNGNGVQNQIMNRNGPMPQSPTLQGPPQQKYEVYMRCVTWSRDSHGLFDYESKNIAKKNIKTQTGGKILRVNDDVEFVSIRTKPEDLDPKAKPMIIVRQSNGQFSIQNDTLVAETPRDSEGNPIPDEDVNNKMFVVVRNTKSAQNNLDYKLGRGDIVKLGRIKFSVKDYRTKYTNQTSCTKNQQQNEGNNYGEQAHNQEPGQSEGPDGSASHENMGINQCQSKQLAHERSFDSLYEEFEEEAVDIDCGVVDPVKNPDVQCKVCWDNSSTVDNPLLNSCQCDGSVRFIHYECLKYWLKQKMAKKEEANLISYTWKQFECEICKKPYPYVFRSNGISYRLIDVEHDIPADRNFLLLESLTFEKNSSRMVHLILPDQEKKIFKLGRGHESDVRVSDISVSRCHALIKYNEENGRFYLEDNLSKFGTLVLAKSSIELEPEMTKAVQIGRSVISFTVKPNAPQLQLQENQLQKVAQAQNCNITSSQSQKSSRNSKDQASYKTPSPQKQQSPNKCQGAFPQDLALQAQHQQVEEMLRQRIEETNFKINQFMQTAIAQHIQNSNINLNNLLNSGDYQAQSTKPQDQPHKRVSSLSNQKKGDEDQPVQSTGRQPSDCEGQIVDSAVFDPDAGRRGVKEDVKGLGLGPHMTELNGNVNLQHLLRATNHLKIAQNEFELAKKQLLTQGSRGQLATFNQLDKGSEALGSSSQSDLLKLQAQHLSAPAFNQAILSLPDEAHSNRRSSLIDDGPYSQQYHPQNGTSRPTQRNSNSQQKGTLLMNNFSDQKTPNGHPSSFLYRAHINLNELSQPDQKNLENEMLDSQGDEDQFTQNFRQQYMMQANEISAFSCSDNAHGEDADTGFRPPKVDHQYQFNEGRRSLRLPETAQKVQQMSQSTSPFRNQLKDISLFSNEFRKTQGGCQNQQQQRDHSEVTSTSVGPLNSCSNSNEIGGYNGAQMQMQTFLSNQIGKKH